MANIIGSEDREKYIYSKQIQYLDKLLERRQLQCDQLKKKNKNLASMCRVLENDKKEIAECLEYSIVTEEKKVEELVERLLNQRHVAEQDKEALKLKHSRQLQEMQEQIQELTSESTVLEAKFKEHQELEERVMQLKLELESLEEQTVSQREENEATVNRLKTVSKKEKMDDEMWSTVGDYVEAEVANVIQKERAEHSELREKAEVLLNENEDLWQERDNLRDQEECLCFEMDTMKNDLNKVTQKTFKKETLQSEDMQL